MHLQLDSRPSICDVSADGLALQFSSTAGLDVVATLSGTLAAGLPVEVEVLAASHRVHVFDDDGLLVTEQVACVVGCGGPLPGQAEHVVRRHRVQFASEQLDFDAPGLADRAGVLRAGATDDHALVVSFPGHPDALTSVRLVPDGWESWHLYPGERPHAVRTRTTVTER